MKWQKTQAGRVVYDRKIHRWNLTDAKRICKKAGSSIVKVSLTDYVAIGQYIAGLLGVEGVPVGFGGGEFGGGGATREFDAASGEAFDGSMLIYIEENGKIGF